MSMIRTMDELEIMFDELTNQYEDRGAVLVATLNQLAARNKRVDELNAEIERLRADVYTLVHMEEICQN